MATRDDIEPEEEELAPREKATRLFSAMINDCGPDVVRMPASCETYLSRYLIHHPVEAKLLIAVVRDQLPTQLLAHEATEGYTAFLDSLIDEFAQTQHLPRKEAKWAVELWAKAVGRPRGYVHVEPDIDPAELYPDPERDKQYDNFAKAAMLFIVAGGGFFGTFLAISLIPVLGWAYGADPRAMALNAELGAGGEHVEEWAYFLFAFIAGAGCGLIGAAGAIMGWMFGGGDSVPWTTASVASGAAFMSVYVCLFATFLCCIPILFSPFIHLGMVFMATFKSAARGGNY